MSFGQVTSRIRHFVADEDGSFTVESVIWMPIFFILLAITMNVSMVFFNESQMLRVVQDANRAFSLGRFDDMQETEDYITARLSYLDTTLSVQSTMNDDGIISTVLSAPAIDLMPMNFMRDNFSGIRITVSSDHIVEF